MIFVSDILTQFSELVVTCVDNLQKREALV